MSTILRIAAIMLLVYLLAGLSGNGEIFRSSSGFLMLAAISIGVYLLFRPKKKPSAAANNQLNTAYNSTEIVNKKPVKNTGAGWIYGLIASIVVVYLFRDFFGNTSFQFFLFMDNMLRLTYSSDPVFMWAVLGLFFGLVCGSFVAWKKYRLAFKVNLIPAAIFLLIIFILIKMNEP